MSGNILAFLCYYLSLSVEHVISCSVDYIGCYAWGGQAAKLFRTDGIADILLKKVVDLGVFFYVSVITGTQACETGTDNDSFWRFYHYYDLRKKNV